MLKLKDSIFGNTLSIYLNNALYSPTKFNDILTSYNSLHSILSSGEFKFPTLNVTVDEIKDNVNLLDSHTFTKLTNESGNILGYSKLKIYEETNPDIDLYLDDLPDEYRNILLQLHTIYEISNKNLNHYRLLLYLLNNLNSIYVNNCNLNTFDFYNTIFRFIYFKKPLSSMVYKISNFNDTQLLTIPTLMMVQALRRVYYKLCTDYINDTSYSIYSQETLPINQPSHLIDSFKDYLVKYRDSISDDVTKYIINNIFLFGYNVSPYIFDSVQDIISDCVISLHESLSEFENQFDPTDYVYRIISETMSNASYSSIMSKLFTSDSVLLNIDYLTGFNVDARDKIYQYEDIILSNIVKYINKHIGTMKHIVNIPIPFTSNPIYFMNAFSLIFNKYTLNYLQSTECFTYSDLQSWLDVILNPDNINITNILSYINKNPVIYMRSDYQLATFLVLQDFIISFCQSKHFANFIIEEFIPRINNRIVTLYKININWHQYVDKLIYFFRLKFTMDLLDTIQNKKQNLFSNVYSFLLTTLDTSIKTYRMQISEADVKSIFAIEYGDLTKWYNLLNSFFKNAAITKYGQNYMAKSYSL